MCINGHTYLDGEHVGLSPGMRLTIKNVETGPCPVCGAEAVFENGVYYETGTLPQRIAIAIRAARAIAFPEWEMRGRRG